MNWSEFRIVPQGFDKFTGYKIRYNGHKHYMAAKMETAKPTDKNALVATGKVTSSGGTQKWKAKPKRNKKFPQNHKSTLIHLTTVPQLSPHSLFTIRLLTLFPKPSSLPTYIVMVYIFISVYLHSWLPTLLVYLPYCHST